MRTHLEIGVPCQYVNTGFTGHNDGLSRGEGDALYAYRDAKATSPEIPWRFHWHLGSIASWDNRGSQRFACSDYCLGGARHESLTITACLLNNRA